MVSRVKVLDWISVGLGMALLLLGVALWFSALWWPGGWGLG